MLLISIPGLRIRLRTGGLINNSRQIRKTKARAIRAQVLNLNPVNVPLKYFYRLHKSTGVKRIKPAMNLLLN